MRQLAMDALHAGVDEIRESPRDAGTVEMIVARPAVDERVVLEEARLEVDEGLVGDTWRTRGSRHTDDGSALVLAQVTLMNARAAALMAGPRERWPLAGDQFYVDLHLGYDNLPPGTRLAMGSAVLEITTQPHRGCVKFSGRFGRDALKFVNSEAGRELNLRGIYARVISPGVVRAGDAVRKVIGRKL